jgi:hypothetical protein
MVYLPAASLVAERAFSIRTGLEASTVTPGSTPPDESLTRPEMLAWAKAPNGRAITNPIAKRTDLPRMHSSLGPPTVL